MKNSLQSDLKKLKEMDPISVQEIPGIDLYMDQLTSFMDDCLSQNKRYTTDKVLTKTMINNYAKNNLLPPPVRKKYQKNHILLLLYIYYFKSFLSIHDIEELLHPLTESFWNSENPSLSDIYMEISRLGKQQNENLKQDLDYKLALAETSFADAPVEEQDILQRFAFLCMLGFDIYQKKQLMEQMIDSMGELRKHMNEHTESTGRKLKKSWEEERK